MMIEQELREIHDTLDHVSARLSRVWGGIEDTEVDVRRDWWTHEVSWPIMSVMDRLEDVRKQLEDERE